MQKILFNDRYGLTQAVIEGRKTTTRRIEFDDYMQKELTDSDAICYGDGCIEAWYDGRLLHQIPTRYQVGEVVAVAQSYNDATREFPHLKTTLVGHDIMGSEPGCTNKMFVRADLMPHQIRITGIRCERLWDISDEDCLREGIFVNEYFGKDGKCHQYGFDGFFNGRERWFAKGWYDTPRAAFAALIDKVSGRGTWRRNPWVAVYEFELVK